LSGQHSTYHALFPRAWTIYDGMASMELLACGLHVANLYQEFCSVIFGKFVYQFTVRLRCAVTKPAYGLIVELIHS
jgi:hypothetical protein